MKAPHPRFGKEEFAQRGDEIDEHDIHPRLVGRHEGEFVAIDIETGAYEFGHGYGASSISRISESCNSSSATATYSRMAASMFSIASASVCPWDQQPGRPGTDTLQPSSDLRRAIRYLIGELLQGCDATG